MVVTWTDFTPFVIKNALYLGVSEMHAISTYIVLVLVFADLRPRIPVIVNVTLSTIIWMLMHVFSLLPYLKSLTLLLLAYI